MFLKMLLGALARQKRKHLLIALTVGLGVSLATAMLGVMFDVGDKVNQELKSYGANLTVIPKGASMLGELYQSRDSGEGLSIDAGDYLPENELYKIKMIFWAYNIVDFAPYLTVGVDLAGQGDGNASSQAAGNNEPAQAQSGQGEGQNGGAAAGKIPLVGTWFKKTLNLPTGETVETGMTGLKSWWTLTGEPGDDEAADSVLVGAALAKRLSIKIGDSFEVRGPKGGAKKLTVRGLFDSGGEDDGSIFAPLALAQELSGREGLVQRVEVSALTTPENDLARRAAKNPGSLSRVEWDTWYCTAYISSIAYQIEEILPMTRVKPILRVAQSEGAILEKTQLMIILLTALTLLCSALAISNLVTASVMERSVEIGLMKALGATGLSIALLALCEILSASFIGGIAGYLAGLGLSQLIGLTVFGSFVAVKLAVIPIGVLMVLVVSLLGSLPALRALLSLRPTEVLHGR